MPDAGPSDPASHPDTEVLRLVDHHCHGVVTTDVDTEAFEALLNEGSAPAAGTSYVDSMLGVALRRWCAPVLDLEPHVPTVDYLARRVELGPDEVNRRFLQAAGLSDLLVDTGFDADRLTGPEQTADYAGARGHEIVRLEAIGQDVLTGGVGAPGFADAVRLRLATGTYAGAKSIAAYRVGLALRAEKPDDDTLVAAVREVEHVPGFRIAHPVVNSWLAHTAVEAGLPLQFHVGYGDNDVELRDCDPLLLTPFLRSTQDRGVPVLLLHNYPFHRHASYLAQVFSQVYMDLGLATHNTGALSATILRESLELVPFSKMLFSSDAFGLAELYYLGSLLFRRGLAAALDPLVAAGELSGADAGRFTAMVAHENARRAYGLR